MSDAERTMRVREAAERVMNALPDADLKTDIGVITGALGAVIGMLAGVTGAPGKFMNQINGVAQGVIASASVIPESWK
jgi:hypothetical protein